MIGSYRASYTPQYWAFGLCADRMGMVLRAGPWTCYVIWRMTGR